MSLISVENILEPLTNKVHLVTIILVMIVFAVLRLQGGGLEIRTDLETPRLHKRRPPAESALADERVGVSDRASEERGVTDRRSNRPFLERVLEEADREAARQAASRQPVEPAPDTGLDDIERTLGLR